MFTQANARPVSRGGVIGLSLGRFAFIGAGVAAIFGGTALAGPEGAKVVRGNAKIHQNGNFTRIKASNGAIINYDSFNLGANERVRFVQPDASARVLNRISGEAPTLINGSIRANGNVYFVNPAGITFGNGAVVNVGGLYAAAGNISNRDFINNTNHFSGVNGAVVNEGAINADGGMAALIGREVANRGVITADNGVVAMVAGEDVVLQQRGSNISVKVDGLARTPDQQTAGTGVENSGTVSAKRGRALMVAGDMYSLAINNTGTVKARNTTIEGQGNATVSVGGTIDARNAAEGSRGGTVEITGNKVLISDAKIDASGTSGGGTVNIGGELQGTGDLRTADTTLVSTGSEITANAIESGNGGQVVVWADNHTGFYGKASADGGARDGNGGFIETSGKETLDIRGGRVSASSVSGKGENGTWLLDPRNVTIDAVATTGGTFDAGNPDTFTPNADDAIVDVADIVTALEGGTNVQILTGNTGTQDGNITVASAITKGAGGAATLTLRAANDVNVNADITSTAGALSVELFANDATNGNDDLNGASGSVSLASGVTIDTLGGNLTVRGEGFAADAASTITAGAGAVDVDVNGNVTLGEVSANSLTVVAAGTYQGLGATGINTTNNASITTDAGNLTLGAMTVGGTLTADATGGDITQTGALAITGTSSFTARNNTGGEVFLTDDTNTFGGGVTLVSRTGDDSTFGDGDLNVHAAGTLPIAAATTTGDLSLTADDFAITGATRGDASIGLNNLTAGTDIFVGGTGTGISLSAAELAFLDTDGGVQIGQPNAGAISVGADGAIDLSAETWNRLTLWGSDIAFTNGITLPDDATASLIAVTGGIDGSNPATDLTIGGMTGSLVVDAAGDVNLDTELSRVAADLSAGSFTLRNDGNLRVAMVDSTSGVTVASGEDIDITGDGGITVNFGVTTSGAGTVTLTAEGGDAGNLIVNTAVAAVDGLVTLNADNDITLNSGGSVASTNGAVALVADFDNATSGGPLDGGSIATVSGASVTAGTIADLSAGGGIDLVSGFTATAGDAMNLTAGGDVAIDAALTAASFAIDAGNDVDVGVDLASTGAAGISIIAGGDVMVDATRTVSTAGNPLSITAADLVLLGSLNAGAGNIAIERNGAGTVGVGAATGDMTVSGEELTRMTAMQVSIGGADATVVTVDGLTATQTQNAGTVAFDATGNGGRIVFSGTGSTFNAVTANADDGIDVNADVRADTGDIVMDGDADNAVDTDDAINIGLGVVIATTPDGDNIVLSAASGGIVGAGAITIDANQDLTINDAVTAPGSIALFAGGTMTLGATVMGNSIAIESDDGVTLSDDLVSQSGSVRIDADVDDDGTGTLLVESAATVQSNGNGIEITAADLQLDGVLSGGDGDITIVRATDGTLGLGSATGDMQLSGDELTRISCETLFLGDRHTTNTTVDGVTAAHTANILTGLDLSTNDIDVAGGFELANGLLSIDRGDTGSIGLGTASGDLTIDNDELSRITANALTLGGDMADSFTVSGVTAAASNGITDLLTLTAQDTITFSSGASTFNSLLAQANELIRVNSNVSTDTGNLTLNGDFDGGGSGTNGVTFNNNRTLSSAGLLLLQAGSGALVGSGALTLNAAEGVQITANLTTNGETTINSDTDADGGVTTIALSRSITTNSSALSITGSDLALEGSLNSGAGQTLIRRSTSGTVGVGTATGNDMTLTGAELQRIIATGLFIGGDNATRVVVNGVTAANVASIASGVTLEALADGGQVEFTGTNSAFGALTASADNGVIVNAQVTTTLDDLVFNPNADDASDGNDSLVLNDDIGAGTHDVNVNGNTRIGQNAIVSGNDVRFFGTIRSRTDTARTLTVNTTADGITLFGGRIGGGDRPLAALTTNVDGVTRIGADITTSGGTMTFFDQVRIQRDVTLTDNGGTGIFFNNTLEASPTSTPTLSIRWLNNNLPADNTLPIVSFNGDVGAVRPLGAILFNYDVTDGVDGRVNVPRIATIIARPRNSSGVITTNPSTPYGIVFNTVGEFRMGQNEKLTVGGDITINAGSAVLGDIAALGDITVNAPTIEVNSRQPGALLAPDGSIGQDMGLDFVSGGLIDFAVTPTVNGGQRVAFSTPDGTGDSSGNLSSFIFQAFGPLDSSLINRTVNSAIITLDLRAEGPTNTNVADALAGAIPRETRFNDVGEDPVVGQAEIEELRQLGIIPRTLDLPELLALLVGWGLYNDYPTAASDGAATYTTAVNRLPGPEVTALLGDYDRTFNRDLVDEDGQPVLDENGKVRRVSRASEIQDALYQSVRRFLTANPGTTSIDPARFRAYLDTSADETVSRQYVEQLADFITRLEYLGLTPRELALSKNVLLAPVRPRGIATMQQFESVIRGSEMATTGN